MPSVFCRAASAVSRSPVRSYQARGKHVQTDWLPPTRCVPCIDGRTVGSLESGFGIGHLLCVPFFSSVESLHTRGGLQAVRQPVGTPAAGQAPQPGAA